MYIILAIIIVLAASFILWRTLSRKQDREKLVSYVCPQCGEHDCDCYREDKTNPADTD